MYLIFFPHFCLLFAVTICNSLALTVVFYELYPCFRRTHFAIFSPICIKSIVLYSISIPSFLISKALKLLCFHTLQNCIFKIHSLLFLNFEHLVESRNPFLLVTFLTIIFYLNFILGLQILLDILVLIYTSESLFIFYVQAWCDFTIDIKIFFFSCWNILLADSTAPSAICELLVIT